MVLVVIGSTWWVTMGRYTDAPTLVNMTKAQAELYAKQHHFELFYAAGHVQRDGRQGHRARPEARRPNGRSSRAAR